MYNVNMKTNMNSLPLPVVSAIVAHFEHDHDELHFSHKDVRIQINSFYFVDDSNSWCVTCTHVSGQDIRIVVRDNQILTMSTLEDGDWVVFYIRGDK
jgi:hypothetical protein